MRRIDIKKEKMRKMQFMTEKFILVVQRHSSDELQLLLGNFCPDTVIIRSQVFDVRVDIYSVCSIELAISLKTNDIAVFQKVEALKFFISALENIPEKYGKVGVLSLYPF